MITDDDTCPVPDELIGRLYRSSQHDINELVSSLSSSRRGAWRRFAMGARTCAISDLLSPRPATWRRWWGRADASEIFWTTNRVSCRM